jgi:hypothetical protein
MSPYSRLLTPGPADHIDARLCGEIDLTAIDEVAGIAGILAATSIQVDLQAVTFFAAADDNFLPTLRTPATEQHAALTVRSAPFCLHRRLALCGLGDLPDDRADSTSRTATITCLRQERQGIGPTGTPRDVDACAGPP